jgi:hypothetical protein
MYTGGISITGYKILWDAAQGGLSYTQISSTSLSASLVYTFSNGIIIGRTYSFKVIACNSIGDSIPS